MPYIQLTFIEVDEAAQEIIIAALSEINFDSFQQNENELLAFVDKDFFNESKVKNQLQLYGQAKVADNFSFAILEDVNWNKKWEENYHPIIIADQLLIKAPFHNIEQQYPYEIELSPKMAFGTGHHETTYMMLKQMLDVEFKNKSVLDYGCGTGILAILAAIKNAKTIDAIDIDDWAYRNTLENIKATNHQNINVQQGDINLVHHKRYNIILANINKNVILMNLEKLYEMLLPNGSLLLSGILKKDIEDVSNVLSDLFSNKPVIKNEGKWIMMAVIK